MVGNVVHAAKQRRQSAYTQPLAPFGDTQRLMDVVVFKGDSSEELAKYDHGVPEADMLSDLRETEGPGALLRSTGVRVTSSSSVPADGHYRFHARTGEHKTARRHASCLGGRTSDIHGGRRCSRATCA